MKFYRFFVKIWHVICLITKHIDSRNFTQHKMKRNQLQLAGLTKLLTRILAISSHLAVDEIARPVPRNCFSVKVLGSRKDLVFVQFCWFTERRRCSKFEKNLSQKLILMVGQYVIIGIVSKHLYFTTRPESSH